MVLISFLTFVWVCCTVVALKLSVVDPMNLAYWVSVIFGGGYALTRLDAPPPPLK